jgi:FkbM family methyltransferase
MPINISAVSPRSFAGKLLRFPLKAIPRNKVVPIIQGRLKGKKWIVGSSIHGCWLGTYELSKQEKFIEVVRPGWRVLDVGANVGYYSLLASELIGSTGSVTAFEPVPRNLGYLHRHITLNECRNISVIEAAVTGYCGTVRFDNTRSGPTGRIDENGPLEVTAITLDSLIQSPGFKGADCIKMDIEGAEYEALKGAQQLLSQFHPAIFLATHGEEIHKRCCDLLTGMGYRLEPLQGKYGNTLADTDELLAVWNRD